MATGVDPVIPLLLNHRKWPEAWKEWREGYNAWFRFGNILQTVYTVFIKKNINPDTYPRLLTMINSLPQSSSYNLLKADIIVTMIEEILLKRQILKEVKLQYLHAAKLMQEAVNLVPDNYIYRYNLIYLYQISNQQEKMEKEIKNLWAILPDHLKKEKNYLQLIEQFGSLE